MSEIAYNEREDAPTMTPEASDGWNKWLQAGIEAESAEVMHVVADALVELKTEYAGKLHQVELRLAELAGAVNVLRTGKSLNVRGTYDLDAEYTLFDIVALGGSSFVALKDRPGRCPGEGWQLLASAGSRGARGQVGPKGERGERGENAAAVAGIKGFHLSPEDYTLSVITTDGKVHALCLRGMFEQFAAEVRAGR